MRQQRYVYFIKPVGMEGPIKIGCSIMPTERLEGLAVWSPFPLEIVAAIPGGHELERAFHDRFANLHSHREWFNPGMELVQALQRIVAGVPVERAVDLSKATGCIRKAGKGSKPESAVRKGYRSYSSRVRWAQEKLRRRGEDTAWYAPEDVQAILANWYGRGKRGGVRPTAGEFRRLDQYLTDPAAHSVLPHWVRPSPKRTSRREDA